MRAWRSVVAVVMMLAGAAAPAAGADNRPPGFRVACPDPTLVPVSLRHPAEPTLSIGLTVRDPDPADVVRLTARRVPRYGRFTPTTGNPVDTEFLLGPGLLDWIAGLFTGPHVTTIVATDREGLASTCDLELTLSLGG